MVYLSRNEQRCGKMLGKSPNRTVPNSKHKPNRDLVCRRRLRRAARRKTQLEEAPFSRFVSLKAAVRGGSHPSPCSAGSGLGTLRPHGRRNHQLRRHARTRLPSLNKLFYTIYKETRTVPPAIAPTATGDPHAAHPGIPAPPAAMGAPPGSRQ